MRQPIRTLVIAASSLLLCVGIAAADGHRHHGSDDGGAPGFTNADFQGTYADSFSGTVVGTGVLTADGNGNITSGTETVSDGTNVCKGTLTGTYSVNPDGTGTLTTTFTTSGSAILGTCPGSPVTRTSAFVMKSRRSIATSEEDAGLLVTGHLEKQHNDNGQD